MMRKLAVALSLASVLGSGVVQALGLGEASVESTLNQPLKAEIELVNIRDLEDNEILPGLASREEFLKANVERIYFLSDVRFEVKRNDSGDMVVQLTTTKPVREPFLNFLVEVIWPSGRLLREYALLIDPPIYGNDPVAAIQPVESTSTATVDQLPAIETVDDADSTSQRFTPSAQSSSSSQAADIYGPTTNNDTMWAIALKVRPDSSVTAQQTMLAIQDLNPDSFINDNINTLKKGQILRLPTLNDIRQRSKRDAVRGVIAQNRAFENKALTRNVVDATPSVETQTPDASTAPVMTPKTGDELKLVVAETSTSDNQSGAHAGESGNEGSVDALKNELAITLEKLDQSGLEKQELNSRVADLEEQLETLQRLLTLKDDQLANLQVQAAQSEETVSVEDDSAVENEGQNKGAPETAAEQVSDIAASTSEDSTTDTLAAETTSESMVAEGAEAEGTETDSSVAESAAPEHSSTETAKAVTPKTTAEDSSIANETSKTSPGKDKFSVQTIVDMVMNNPMYQMAAAGIVLLLLLIVWAMSRKNAQREEAFHNAADSDVDDSTSEGLDEVLSELDDSDATLVDLDGDSAQEDTDAPQPETEDVIAEANIYIAYGRLDQAAQLLESAVSSEPQRIDTRLKLLEVYAESNESELFDKQFNEVSALNDNYATEQAEEIKSRFNESEETVSLDDLESQLLSGDDEPTQVSMPEENLEVEQDSESEKEDDYSIDYEPTQIAQDIEEDNVDIDEEISHLEADLALDGVGEDTSLEEEDNLDIDFDINEIDLELDGLAEDDSDSVALTENDQEDAPSLDIDSDDVPSLDLDAELGLGESPDLDEQQDSVDDGLDIDPSSLEFDTELDEALAGVDEELDEVSLDSADESDEVPSLTAAEADKDSDDDLDIAIDELEGDLNLDDLDLELDKIDSELDDNYELDAGEVEALDSAENSESSVDIGTADSVDTEGQDDEFDVLSSDEAVEELEDIAETLTLDDAQPEEATEVDEGLELDETLDLDVSLEVDESDSHEASDSDVDDSVLDKPESVNVDEFDAGISDDEDFDFLEGTDEAATKLDLARAYIDMGDGDGAKDILEEVVLEGSDAQKQEAQDLLKTLD